MLNIGVDWIALSFVQRPEDIVEIQGLIRSHNPANAFPPHVMAKIEKPSCFDGDNLEKIVELCDGIMVARGDLGVECQPEDVPILQKTIIDECRHQGKPVVVSTQISKLRDSMSRSTHWFPIRLVVVYSLQYFPSSKKTK